MPGRLPLLTFLALILAIPASADRLGRSAVAIERRDARRLPANPVRLLQGPLGEPITPPSADSPEDVARAYVEKVLAPPGDLDLRRLAHGAGGITFVTLEQSFGGVPVALGRVTVAVDEQGRVRAAMLGDLAREAPHAAARPRGADASSRLAALRASGLTGARSLGESDVYVATARGTERARRLVVAGARPDQQVDVIVSDEGETLLVQPAAFPAAVGGRVVPQDPPRGLAMRAFAEPRANPSHDSPLGWAAADMTEGNNAIVGLDREADFDDTPNRPAVATGVPPTFDFTYTGDPAVDTELALANVFWAINDAHDRFRRLGFDEASGACQADSLGRGGRGGDAVHALVQYDFDGVDTNYEAVTMGVGPDGNYTWLAVGVFRDANGDLRDGALDTDLLYHELTHAATVRLVGDDDGCVQGAQPQALLEGWGDFFAASFTDDPVIGAFTSGLPTGQRVAPVGLSNLSYENLCPGGQCDRYVDGMIWADLLWDMRQVLRSRLGPAAGTRLAEKLALEGMRYTPCRPTFLDARDGLLLAESAVSQEQWHCDLWGIFVNRGLGYSARSTGPDDMLPTAAYDLAPECASGAALALDRSDYGIDDEAVVVLHDVTPPANPTVTLTSTSGDSVTLPLVSSGGPALRAVVRLAPGPVNAGDSVLQVAPGDTVEARHAALLATAVATGASSVRLLDHHVWGTWCQMQSDDDYSDRWWRAPGFLDAGEVATIEVGLGNDTLDDLEDLEFSVTSLSPTVRVLPTGPTAVGTIARRTGTGSRRFEIEFKAEALPTAAAGERADIRIDLRSRGRATSVTLPLELNMDYVEQPLVTPFQNGVETFDAATSTTWSQWTTLTPRGFDNQWLRESCAGSADPFGWSIAQAGCQDYIDGQVATVLLSPPIMPLPPDAVAIRMVDWSVDVDSAMGRDVFNGFCDADWVGWFVVTDAADIDYADPEYIYSGAAERYWRPIYEDTGGFVTQSPNYYDRGPQLVTPGPPFSQLRFAFVFWGNVYDCGTMYPNTGRFRLDDVRFTYDVLRKVPEATPCAADCILHATLEADPPGPKCPGEPFTLRAVGTESINCNGTIHYSFGGPGVPGASGWTTTPESPAIGQDGAYWSLYLSCDAVAACDDYHQFTLASPAPPSAGYVSEDSLRVRKSAGDVVLSWSGAAVPPSYGVFRTTQVADLAAGPTSWPLLGRQDVEASDGSASWSHAGGVLEPGVSFYVVYARDRCTDAPRP